MSEAIDKSQKRFIRVSGCLASKTGLRLSHMYGEMECLWDEITFVSAVRLKREQEEEAPLFILVMKDLDNIYYIQGTKINPNLFIFENSHGKVEMRAELWVRTEGSVEKHFKWLSEKICSRLTLTYIDKPLVGSIKGGVYFLPLFTSLKEIGDYCFRTICSVSEDEARGAQALEVSDEELKAVSAPSTDRKEWEPGTVFDEHFTVTEVLKGGMGIVYVIFDSVNVKYLALKTFQEKFLWDEKVVNQFIKEAEIWVKLEKNPNIVTANLVRVIEGKPYICVEYVQGGDLEKLLKERHLDVREALQLGIQFCNGMDYAFRKLGLIHRDIKPSNCLITRDGLLKITDFGLGKIFDDLPAEEAEKGGARTAVIKEVRSTSTTGTSIVGTLPYMAPELFSDMRSSGQKTDIYSFGLVLFLMLTGVHPLYSDDPEELIVNHLSVVPDHPSGMNPEIPVRLGDVAMKCVEKEPELRPSNFAEIKKELNEIYESSFGEKYELPVEEERFSEEDWLNKGISLASLGKHKEALLTFDMAIDINPGSIEAKLSKGSSLMDLGRHEEALECLDSAKKLKTDDWRVWSKRGEAFWKLGKLERALSCFDLALKFHSEPAELYGSKGKLLTEMGRFEEALRCFDIALDKNHKLEEVWDDRGTLLMRMSHFDEATDSFVKAIEINPRFQKAWRHRGDALYRLAFYSEALSAYQKALSCDPQSIEERIGSGNCYREMGNTKRAVLSYNNAISMSPANSAIYVEKIYMLMRNYQFEEALECIYEAEKNSCRDQMIRTAKARVLLELACYEDCIKALSEEPPGDDWETQLLLRSAKLMHDERKSLKRAMSLERARDPEEVFNDVETAYSVFCDINDAITFLFHYVEERENAHLWYVLAALQMIGGRLEDAEKSIDISLKINGESPESMKLQKKIRGYIDAEQGNQAAKKGILDSLFRREKKEDMDYMDLLKNCHKYMQQKNYPKALSSVEEALRLNTRLYGGLFLRARLKELLRDYTKAMEYYERFYATFRNSWGFYRNKVLSSSPIDTEPLELEGYYEKWIGAYPQAISPWILLIKYLMAQGKAEKARLLILEFLDHFSEEELMRQDPMKSFNLLGVLNLQVARMKSALFYCSKACELHIEDDAAKLCEAKCFEYQRKEHNARSIYKKLAERDNPSLLAVYYLSGELQKERKFDEALDMIEKAIRIRENSITLRHRWAEILVQNDKISEFLLAYQELYLMNKYFSPLKILKSMAYVWKGRIDEAVNEMENAVGFEQNNPLLLKRLAYLYCRGDAYSKALKVISDILKAYKLDPEIYLLQGIASFNLQRYAEAFESFQNFGYLRPNSPESLVFMGMAQYHLNNIEFSESLFKKAQALKYDSTFAWINLGIFYLIQGKDSLALQFFEGALRIDSESFQAWMYRSICQLRLGNLGEAQKSIERALYFPHHHKDGWILKGIIEFRLQNYGTCAESFTKALGIDEKDEVIWYNLGVANLFNRNIVEAGKAFDRALGLREDLFEAYIGKAILSYFSKEQDGEAEQKSLRKAQALAPAKFERWLAKSAACENPIVTLELLENITISFEPSVELLSWQHEPVNLVDILDQDEALK